MIKERKINKEIIEKHKYCDICGAEIRMELACNSARCMYCRRDLCEKCIGYEEEDRSSDYRDVWCKDCWELGNEYRPKIEKLDEEIRELYEEWQTKCKQFSK